MKTLIYELYSGVGLCNQLFSFETAIYLSNITKRKLVLLIRNPLCHCGRATWSYGYLLNYFTNDFMNFLPYGFEVYYEKIPFEIEKILDDEANTQHIKYSSRFSNIVFVDEELDTIENQEDIKKFCHMRGKESLNFEMYEGFPNIYISQSNASRCFYNFYTNEDNYQLMRDICASIKFKPFLYDIANVIYSQINLNNNAYNIFVHTRFGDYHKKQDFIERYNNIMVKNLSEYFDGHKTNMIKPKIYLLVDNKKNTKFNEMMKKHNWEYIDEITTNYIKNFCDSNKHIFYDFHNIRSYDVATAIVEMILSSRADEFVGTSSSTFSHYIQYMRFCNHKSSQNYCNLEGPNFKYCKYLQVQNSNYDWIKYKYRGGHPVAWHNFWNINYKPVLKPNQMMTIVGKTDGFGSQLQACFSLLAYCKYKGYEYIHTPMYRMHHNDENQDEFPKYMNSFINFEHKFRSYNDLSNYEKSLVHGVKEGPFVHGSLHPEFFYNDDVIKTIRELYYSKEKPEITLFEKNKRHVSIHIRRGDVNLKKYPSRYTRNIEYIRILVNLELDEENDVIHIFSQGDESEFSDITDHFKDYKVVLHINENIQLTFHSMVKSDILVVAKSSFSYCAALLNENLIISSLIQRWWHKPLKQWKLV